MRWQQLPKDFYENIKPRLYRRIGRELRPAHRVLDLGCGSCELDRYLASEYQLEVTGVDVTNGSFPRQDKPRAGRDLFKCIRGDALHLDFLSDAKMDAVVSVYSLHEMKDAEGALREAFRVLRPGGEILIVDFPRESLAQRLWNENYFSVAEMRGMLVRAAFREVRVKTIEQGQVIWATGYV